MSDPLSLLREYLSTGKRDFIKVKDDDIIIGSTRFPRNMKTAWRRNNKPGDFYTLDAIRFCVENEQLKLSTFIKKATEEEVMILSFGDKKPLLDYLYGRVDHSPYIDTAALAEQKLSRATKKLKAETKDGKTVDVPTKTESIDVLHKLHDAKSVEDVVGLERELVNRLSMLQSHKKSFKSLLEAYDNAQKDLRRALKDQKGVRHHKAAPTRRDGRNGKKPTSDVPIIIVPSAVTSLITLYNVKDFLQNFQFFTTDYKRKQISKPSRVELEHRSFRDPSKTVKYHVIDDVKHLPEHDWTRVVAVVAHRKWQFDGWPFRGGPAEIFENMFGVHFHWSDEVVESTVRQWRVTRLAIDKAQRYKDKSVAINFWKKLGEFLVSRKKPVNY